MKKSIGLAAALCLLSTMAFAHKSGHHDEATSSKDSAEDISEPHRNSNVEHHHGATGVGIKVDLSDEAGDDKTHEQDDKAEPGDPPKPAN